MIKFLDLHKINSQYEQELKDASNRVIDSGWYLMGKELETFEQSYATFCNVKFALGVANGLDALRLIFRGYIEMGIMTKGDEVIVPANTYIASVLAISDNGLIPVFVEPNFETYNLESNTNLAEQTNSDIDILSNGFKTRSDGNGHNTSGHGYIFMAFAESPFVTSTGIPTTAR